jgi:hypothetical protein
MSEGKCEREKIMLKGKRKVRGEINVKLGKMKVKGVLEIQFAVSA